MRIEKNAVKEALTKLHEALGDEGEYELTAPLTTITDFLPRHGGTFMGVAVIIDPLCPPDQWYLRPNRPKFFNSVSNPVSTETA